jgi:hypothetical protein
MQRGWYGGRERERERHLSLWFKFHLELTYEEVDTELRVGVHEGKVEVRPSTGHKGSEGDRRIALLFL